MRSSLRKLLVVALLLLALGALIYRSRNAISLQGFSWDRLADSVQQARVSLLLLALVSIFVCYLIRALRWVRFSRYLGRPTFGNVFRSTLIGFTAVFLLGRVGEPIRPLLIARKDRLPISGTFGIYALERVFDTASTAVIAALSLLLFPTRLSPGAGNTAWEARMHTTGLVLLAGSFAAVIFLVYFRLHGAGALERRLAGWRAATGWKQRAAGLLAGFGEGLQAIRTFPDLVAAVVYSTAHWILVALIYLWVARSFGGRLAELDFSGAMVVLAFTMVGSTVQLPAVGGGSQAASFLAFTVVFGVEKEPAAAAAIMAWLISFTACSLVGVPLLIREGWSMGELRRLARAEAEAEAAGAHVGEPGVTAKPGEPLR